MLPELQLSIKLTHTSELLAERKKVTKYSKGKMDEFSEIVVFLRSSEVSEAPCPTAVVFCLTLL